MTTTITSKGQIVIPSSIRKRLKIKPGMKFALQEQGNKIVVEPINEHYFDQFVGILKGTNATRDLLKERSRQREKENRR